MLALLLFVIPLLAQGWAAPEPLDVSESLELDNGLDRGTWGTISLCPVGSYAFAFDIKYQDLGYVDDTAMNGLRLYCMSTAGTITGSTTSSEGDNGIWRPMRTCPNNLFLAGFRGNVLPEQGNFGDDMAMENVEMFCSDGTVLNGLTGPAEQHSQVPEARREMVMVEGRELEAVYINSRLTGLREEKGTWSSWKYCSSMNKVCGHQTRTERESAVTDDAGMSDLVIYCCST